MSWFVVVPVGWTVLALVVGLFVGRGIRMSGGGQSECPLPAAAAMPPAASAPPVAGSTAEPIAADLPATATTGHLPGGDPTDHRPARERSLSAAR
jgi:hypothetical protein